MSSHDTSPGGLAPEVAGLLAQAAATADVSEIDLGKTRLRRSKRLFLRLVHPFTHRQTAHNQAMVDALRNAAEEVERLRHQVQHATDRTGTYDEQFDQIYAALEGWVSDRLVTIEKGLEVAQRREADHRILQATVASQEIVSQDLAERMSALERLEIQVREALTRVERARETDRTRLARHGALVDRMLRDMRHRLGEEGEVVGSPVDLSNEIDGFLAEFYEDFEEIYRGTPEEIRSRVEVYLPEVLDLKGGSLSVIDIGCGRGEWLGLLRDHGVPAYGVDTNKRFVEEGLEQGLDVRHGDGLAYLSALADGSVGAVTAFHLVEHLPFETAVGLVDQSLRVLRPGGVLILETPNPVNLGVGAASFYLDPTHVRPVHPDLLSFVIRSRGFESVDLRFLHPAREAPLRIEGLEGVDTEALQWLLDVVNEALFGPQDYAAVARK